MKNKLTLMLCIIFVLLASMSSYSQGTLNFIDVKEGFWAKEAIDLLVDEGILDGYSDGTFKPNKNIKINEYIAMLLKSMGYVHEPINGDWAAAYINKAKTLGVIGRDQYRDFNAELTREEMIRLTMDFLAATEELPFPTIENQYIKYEIKDSDQIGQFILSNVVDAYKLGIISGYPDGTFQPKKIVTRAEASSVLVAVIKPEVRKPYSGNPYKSLTASRTEVPIAVYTNSKGENVGHNYIYNFEYNSLYRLEGQYDENGNMVEVFGNSRRQYPVQIKYITMFAPLYKGKPIDEVIDVVNSLYATRDNGKGYLNLYTDINSSSISAFAYHSKEYYDNIYIENYDLLSQALGNAERMDFSFDFSPFSSYDNVYLKDGAQPFEITLWKKSIYEEQYGSYSKFFVATYGDQIKPIIDILFEQDADKMWNQLIKSLDFQGEAVIVNSTLNNRDYRLLYSSSGINFSVSLKK